jgi:hypothetical protein
MRVGIGLGWGRGVDTRQGIRRPQGPSAGTQTINQKKEASDYETKAPPRHHRHASESLNFPLNYLVPPRGAVSCAAIASGMEAREGGDALGSVHDRPTEPDRRGDAIRQRSPRPCSHVRQDFPLDRFRRVRRVSRSASQRPHAHRAVIIARGGKTAVEQHAQRGDRMGVPPFEAADLGAPRHVPQPDRAVIARGEAAIGQHTQRGDRMGVPSEGSRRSKTRWSYGRRRQDDMRSKLPS